MRVAVICALPPERNTGMATVDLSALCILHRLLPQAEITLYAYGKTGIYAYQKGELPFHHINISDQPEAYLGSDIFIFWGDFIHSLAYWKLDRGAWDERLAGMSSAEQKRWLAERYTHYSRYVFLAESSPDVLARSIVFGSTIITNEAADLLDAAYQRNYLDFFGRAGGVFFRDALSAAKISPLRGNAASLACDCALLLQPDDLKLLQGYRQPDVRRGMGVFFGRSSSKWRMFSFARALAYTSGEQLRWVPWFSTRRRLRWLARIFGIVIPAGDPGPGALLTEVASCRFILTDTYHMCVNAWRMGIPAVCIGDGAVVQRTSLSDKKKEIFYEMYGARRFYVFMEKLVSPWSILRTAHHISAELKRPGLVEAVVSTIHEHAKMAQDRLEFALHELQNTKLL